MNGSDLPAPLFRFREKLCTAIVIELREDNILWCSFRAIASAKIWSFYPSNQRDLNIFRVATEAPIDSLQDRAWHGY